MSQSITDGLKALRGDGDSRDKERDSGRSSDRGPESEPGDKNGRRSKYVMFSVQWFPIMFKLTLRPDFPKESHIYLIGLLFLCFSLRLFLHRVN